MRVGQEEDNLERVQILEVIIEQVEGRTKVRNEPT
jgi:hypothetical protein